MRFFVDRAVCFIETLYMDTSREKGVFASCSFFEIVLVRERLRCVHWGSVPTFGCGVFLTLVHGRKRYFLRRRGGLFGFVVVREVEVVVFE